jgi:hypothetical protein
MRRVDEDEIRFGLLDAAATSDGHRHLRQHEHLVVELLDRPGPERLLRRRGVGRPARLLRP